MTGDTVLLMRAWDFIKSDGFRRLRWGLTVAIAGFFLVGLQGDHIHLCTTDRKSNEVHTTCSPPSLTDAVSLAVIALEGLLIWPELSELGAFGLSLKRRVGEAKSRADEATAEVRDLRTTIQAIQTQVVTLSSATANSSAVVGPILIGVGAIRQAEANLPDKEAAFDSGSEPQRPQVQAPVEGGAPAQVELLRAYETFRAALTTLQDRARHDASAFERAARFEQLFADEIRVVQAARNSVAHSLTVEPEELAAAIDIAQRLTQILTKPSRPQDE